MPDCESAHVHVAGRDCGGIAAYRLYTCRLPNGRPVCAATIEHPERGLATRFQNNVDENVTCTRCGRLVRYCWSWIPI